MERAGAGGPSYGQLQAEVERLQQFVQILSKTGKDQTMEMAVKVQLQYANTYARRRARTHIHTHARTHTHKHTTYYFIE